MVIVVMGVSGSGKTVAGEMLSDRLNWVFEDADNFHSVANVEKMHRGEALTDADREPWLQALNRAVRTWIAAKCDVVLACSALREKYRKALIEGVADREAVRFVYLKGTYEEIDGRLRARAGHFMPESLLKSQFAALEEPNPSQALVIDIGRSVDSIVNLIVTDLRLSPSAKSSTSAEQR